MVYKAIFYDVEINTKNNKVFQTNKKTVYFSDLKCNFDAISYCENLLIKNNLCAFDLFQYDKISIIDIFQTAILKTFYKFNLIISSTSHYIYF